MPANRLAVVVAAALIAISPSRLAAQWPPDSLVNLQVLPKSTSVREIRELMRGVAGALGVRCTHCHVGEDPNNLSSIDFVSDDRIQKRKAREMFRMVQEINGRLLHNVPERSSPPVEVTCVTCHHGVTLPVDIRDLIAETALKQGADSAIARYEAMRAQYYGAASYDFRPFMLANVAERIAAQSPDLAFRLLEYNQDRHPDDQQTYLFTAQLSVSRGDTARAIRALERGLEHNPENEFFRGLLRRLRGR